MTTLMIINMMIHMSIKNEMQTSTKTKPINSKKAKSTSKKSSKTKKVSKK